jgi:hypothetical protein
MDSFRLLKYECIKERTVGEEANIETVVITEGNRAQTVL